LGGDDVSVFRQPIKLLYFLVARANPPSEKQECEFPLIPTNLWKLNVCFVSFSIREETFEFRNFKPVVAG
jgi:hypothetical protein